MKNSEDDKARMVWKIKKALPYVGNAFLSFEQELFYEFVEF